MTKNSRKVTTPKGKAKRSTKAFKTVADNIMLLPSGMYNVRKRVNGVRLSRNFSTVKACRSWLSSL